jgi:hypothetical protein
MYLLVEGMGYNMYLDGRARQHYVVCEQRPPKNMEDNLKKK